MKRNIFYLTISLCIGVFHAQAQELTLTYNVSDGIEYLSCDNDQSFLYKPSHENSYYLYTNSSVIRFDLKDSYKLSNKHIDILSDTSKNGIWPYINDSTKTKHSNQPFKTYSEKGIYIKRDGSRPREIVKDQISIGGLKCYIWNPIQGTVDFLATINDQKNQYHAGDTIHIKAGENIKIFLHAKKKGDGIILNNMVAGDSLLIAKEPIDEITENNTQLESSFEKTFSNKEKSLCIYLKYQILDENFHLENKTEKIYLEIDKKSSVSFWLLLVILIAIGSGFFLLIRAIRCPRGNCSNNQNCTLGLLIKNKEKWEWYKEENEKDEDCSIIHTNTINIGYINSIIIARSRSAHPQKDWQKNNRENLFDIVKEINDSELKRIKQDIINKRGKSVQIKASFNNNILQIKFRVQENNYVFPITINVDKQNPEVVPSNIKGKDIDNSSKSETSENELKTVQGLLEDARKKILQISKELEETTAALNSNKNLLRQKELNINSKELEIQQLKRDNENLTGSYNDIKKRLTEEIEEHDKTKKELSLTETKADERIKLAKLECQKIIRAKEEECTLTIGKVQQECDSKTNSWKVDKEFFLEKICNPVERLYDISDEISRNIESQDKSYNESFEFIVASLSDFCEKVKSCSSESGDWRSVTNAEAEKSIVSELTELIKNNSSWINSIARLYCYSQINEIGAIFEENGVRIQDIDSAYRDMCYFLGLYGINIVLPRILVDYYDEINKKYFIYNNEDIIITRFAGRDILIRNKETLKIYDMGKIAYYLNGKITKGEIVHF